MTPEEALACLVTQARNELCGNPDCGCVLVNEAEAVLRAALKQEVLAEGWAYYASAVMDPPLLHRFGCDCGLECHIHFTLDEPDSKYPDEFRRVAIIAIP